MAKNPIEGSQRLKKNLGSKAGMRVAPRMQNNRGQGGKKGGKK